MWKIMMIITGVICLAKSTSGARVLMVQPFHAKSHENFHTAIAKSLLSAGHSVTFITHFPKSISHSNFTAIDGGGHKDSIESTNDLAMAEALKLKQSGYMSLLTFFYEDMKVRCPQVMQLDEVQKILRSPTKLFDVLITATFSETSECFIPIAEKLDIPVIGTALPRFWPQAEWRMGNPLNPAVIPSVFSPYSYPMTFLQRMDNFKRLLLDYAFNYYYELPELEKFHQKFFPNLDLTHKRKLSLVFINNHPVLTPRPMVPSIISVGGLQVQPAKPLPENLQIFVDGAKDGVILFSIGSIVQSYNMPAELMTVFRETFAQIPQRVIWKAEGQISGLSENVLLSKWLPQRDILAHKNTVAFISHCGIAGTYESLYSGVPMVLLPIVGDQFGNSALLERLGVGVKLDLTDLTKEKLLNALNDVINGTKYHDRVTEVSNLLNDQPMSPQENVVYWTEYVIRHNGAHHLQSPSVNLPLYQYLLLDIIGLILFILFIISVLVYYLLYNIYNYIRREKNISSEMKKKS